MTFNLFKAPQGSLQCRGSRVAGAVVVVPSAVGGAAVILSRGHKSCWWRVRRVVVLVTVAIVVVFQEQRQYVGVRQIEALASRSPCVAEQLDIRDSQATLYVKP